MKSLQMLYGSYVLLMFAVLGLSITVLTLFVPGLEQRRRLARAGARAVLKLAGMTLTVRAEQYLPAGHCIVVANHESYLDGLVLTAALPPRFGFVIKREMARVPLVGLLLKRIGSQFVERFNRQRSAADARRMMRTAVKGHSLVFFPEGTFSPQPGLLKFHTGAFVTAARAGCPVVPTVIRGTRMALPPRGRLPRRALIEVEFLPALQVTPDAAERASSELRDQARAAILSGLEEPATNA